MSVQEITKYKITCSRCDSAYKMFDSRYESFICKSCKSAIPKPDVAQCSTPHKYVEAYYLYQHNVDKTYDIDYQALRKFAEDYYINTDELSKRIKPYLYNIWTYAHAESHSGGYYDIVTTFSELVSIFDLEK